MNLNLIKTNYRNHPQFSLLPGSPKLNYYIFNINNYNNLQFFVLIKSFHCSNVLNVCESPNIDKGKAVETNPNPEVSTAETSQNTQAANVTFDQFEDLINQSNQSTSFDEAFPNYREMLQQSNSNRTVFESLEQESRSMTEIINESPILSELLLPVLENPRAFRHTELFSSGSDPITNFLNVQNIANGNFNALLNKLDETTNDSSQTTATEEAGPSTIRSNSVTNFIRYENGILSVDLNSTSRLFNNALDFARRHSDQIDVTIEGLLLPGLSAYFIYKNVVKLYVKTAFPSDVSHLSPEEQVKYFALRGKQIAHFKGMGAVLITYSLTVITHTILKHFRSKNALTIKVLLGGDEKEKSNLIFLPIFNKIKGPNWFKYLILIIITIIFLIILFLYFPTVIKIFMINKIYMLKLIFISICFIYIIYNLLSIIILLRFSFITDDKIIIPNFLPNKIKNYLLELKEISKFKEINYFIYIYVMGIVFTLIFVIIFLGVTFYFSTF